MRAGDRVDQLAGDAHALASLAHRPFQYVPDAQLAPDLLHVDRLALVGETRISSDDEQPADLGERRDDLLDHAVGEILLLRIAAHIGEGQYRDRRLVGQRKHRRLGSPHPRATHASLPRPQGRAREGVFRSYPIDPYRTGDVLQRLLADVFEGEVQAAGGILLDACRHADATRLGQAFEAGGDVDAVDEDVALVDADAELDAAIRR